MKILILLFLMCMQVQAAWDFGASAADRINTSSSAVIAAGPRSYSVWFYRDGLGGNNIGCLLTGQNDSNKLQINSGTTLRFTADWSPTDGSWDFTLPGTGAWHHIAVTYNSSATTNDPIIYVNGMAPAAGFVQAGVDPSGTFVVLASNIMFGNTNANTRNWDGRIAEGAMWNRILSASEVAGLAKGFSPAFYPNGLTIYFPLVRGLHDWKSSANGVATGAVAFDSHPPMRYPSVDFSVAFISATSPLNILNLNNRRRRE